jgi:hypothetical protein
MNGWAIPCRLACLQKPIQRRRESYKWHGARERPMRERPGPDQIAEILCEFRAGLDDGLNIDHACRKAGVGLPTCVLCASPVTNRRRWLVGFRNPPARISGTKDREAAPLAEFPLPLAPSEMEAWWRTPTCKPWSQPRMAYWRESGLELGGLADVTSADA